MNVFAELGKLATDFWDGLDISLAGIIWALVNIAIILLGAKLLNMAVSGLCKWARNRKRKGKDPARNKRVDSLLTLVHSLSRYLIYFVAIALILSAVGLGKSVSTLIATAGIGGLAIGFGAQNLVRDVVTGLFLMFENQFSVGDYIQAGDAEGTVEAVAVRVTYLRGLMGEQYIIPNGTIGKVTNFNRGDYTALVDVVIAYSEDAQEAMRVMQQAAEEYAKGNPLLVTGEPRVAGVADLENGGITIRTFCPVVPLRQYEVERGLRLAFKLALDDKGIQIPQRMMAMRAEP